MNNLEEFNKNLELLENEVTNLIAIRKAYQKVDDLSKEYEKVTSSLKDAVTSLDAAISELKRQKAFVETTAESQKTLIDKKFETIISSLNDEFNQLDSLISKKSDTINDSNKKFYKDFAEMVQIRLDNHKGDIQRLIEHERSEIKNMFDGQIKSIEKTHTVQFIELETKIKQMKAIVLGFGIGLAIICIVCLILSIIH